MLDQAQLDEVHRKVRVFASLDFAGMPSDALRVATIELVMILPAHFAAEVAPGAFFDRLRRRIPQRLERIQVLLGEHLTLLGDADQLLDRLDHRPIDSELRDQIRTFASRLARHEFEENALAVEATWRADGGHHGV